MVNLYQSDVRLMSDEELRVLSDELEEEYLHTLPCECCSDSEWSDDAAEARYNEMRREINRRWEVANPEEVERRKKLIPYIFSQIALDALNNKLEWLKDIEYSQEKIGDTLQVRTPYGWNRIEEYKGNAE